jgi:hypothetical protein
MCEFCVYERVSKKVYESVLGTPFNLSTVLVKFSMSFSIFLMGSA